MCFLLIYKLYLINEESKPLLDTSNVYKSFSDIELRSSLSYTKKEIPEIDWTLSL